MQRYNHNVNPFLSTACKFKVPVEIYTGEETIRGFMESCSEHDIYVRFLEQNRTFTIKQNAILRIQFVFHGKRYQYTTNYTGHAPEDNGLLVGIPKLIEMVEIRHYARFNINFSLRVYFDVAGKKCLGFVKNMSEGGFLFTSSNPLEAKSAYPFALSLPGNKHICFTSRVVHSNETEQDMYIIGAEVVGLGSYESSCIKNFVIELKSRREPYPGHELYESEKIGELLDIFSEYLLSWKSIIHQRKVLCVETNKIERNLLKKILSSHYEVAFATNGAESTAIIEKFKPDVVLSEINLRDMDFFMLNKGVLVNKKLQDIPFVIYTANNNKTVITNALKEKNVHEYIVKPVVSGELIARLDNVINLSSQ